MENDIQIPNDFREHYNEDLLSEIHDNNRNIPDYSLRNRKGYYNCSNSSQSPTYNEYVHSANITKYCGTTDKLLGLRRAGKGGQDLRDSKYLMTTTNVETRCWLLTKG